MHFLKKLKVMTPKQVPLITIQYLYYRASGCVMDTIRRGKAEQESQNVYTIKGFENSND